MQSSITTHRFPSLLSQAAFFFFFLFLPLFVRTSSSLEKTASSVSVSARNGWTQGPNVNVSQVAAIPAQAEVAVTWGMTVGQAALQGPREEMEDEVVVESDGPNGFVYAAIFDGHAGFSSAQFLRDELYKECVTALEGGSLLESSDLREAEAALTHAFLRADKRLLSLLEESIAGREKESGSTATVMLVRTDRLVMAHVGDSRAVGNGSCQLRISREIDTWMMV